MSNSLKSVQTLQIAITTRPPTKQENKPLKNNCVKYLVVCYCNSKSKIKMYEEEIIIHGSYIYLA